MSFVCVEEKGGGGRERERENEGERVKGWGTSMYDQGGAIIVWLAYFFLLGCVSQASFG